MTLQHGTSYLPPTSLFVDIFGGLSKSDISRLNFTVSLRLTEGMLLPDDVEKNKEKTSE